MISICLKIKFQDFDDLKNLNTFLASKTPHARNGKYLKPS